MEQEGAWRSILAQAARAEVFASGLWQGSGEAGDLEERLVEPGPAVLDVVRPVDIAELVSLLEVAYLSDELCMCPRRHDLRLVRQ